MTIYVSYSTATAVVSAYTVPLDTSVTPFNAVVSYQKGGTVGSVTGNVQITLQKFDNTTPTVWYNVSDASVETGVTALPICAGVRLNITAVSGANVAFSVLQVG